MPNKSDKSSENSSGSDLRTTPSDINLTGLWACLPVYLHPFVTLARLDRPIGWWLLLLPGWWIIAALSPDLGRGFYLMGLFLIGAVVMRAAGCVINDLWDRKIDLKIARTRTRPLASGQITPLQALLFLFLLCMVGLLILLQLPIYSWLVGLCAIPLIILYPLAKRYFGWPQFVLGLTFSWGVPVAAACVFTDILQLQLVLIYAGSVFWVMGYDTIYAVQDMTDDRITGVRSSALSLGQHLKMGIACFYGLAVLFWGAGFFLLFGPDIWIAGLIAIALHFCWQVKALTPDQPKTALYLFQSNRNAGLILCLFLLIQNGFVAGN